MEMEMEMESIPQAYARKMRPHNPYCYFPMGYLFRFLPAIDR